MERRKNAKCILMIHVPKFCCMNITNSLHLKLDLLLSAYKMFFFFRFIIERSLCLQILSPKQNALISNYISI